MSHNQDLTMRVSVTKLQQKRHKCNALLHNLLPLSVVEEMKNGR